MLSRLIIMIKRSRARRKAFVERNRPAGPPSCEQFLLGRADGQGIAVTIVRTSVVRLCAVFYIPVCTVSVACSDAPASVLVAVDSLVYLTSEQAGFSSAALAEAEDYAEQIGSAAVIALHDNRVFFKWGDVDRKYLVHSIRKSLLNSLYSLYVERGVIDTASTLAELEIDDIPPSLSAAEKAARVADLLKSRSGVYHEAAAESQWMKENRPARGSHPPGTYYYYNNWDFNALGTIFRQETGTSIFYAFKIEIAEPIGMESFIATDGHYYYEREYYERELSEHPAYHFRLTAIDLAR